MSVSYPFDTPPGSDVDAEGVRLLAQAPVARADMAGQPVWLAFGVSGGPPGAVGLAV
jgi:hypothetical protein